ncbi:MAG: LON peptidase substrate-binding domain-containing protein, partial [Deltaproteobacteria bacterium]|nr:LON peptidase substrate-binding domain-containing protein [Deltaproteobacteria bacterium]
MFTFSRNKEKTNSNDNNGEIVIPMLPLRDVVVFPHMIVPLFVGREKSINALESAMKEEKGIFLAAQRSAQKDDPTEEDIYDFGTIGNIIQLLRLPDGTVKVLVEGKKRGLITEYLDNPDFFLVKVEEQREIVNADKMVQIQALMRNITEAFESYSKLSKKVPNEIITSIASIDEPAKMADVAVSYLTIKLEEKQRILEITEVAHRLEKIYGMIISETEVLEVEERIKRRVKKQMEKTQKDYYLNEQMRAIQKEMGEEDASKNEIKEIEKRLKEKKLSEEAHKKVKKEAQKLKMMAPMSAEATVVRNYIDWLLDLPWYEKTVNDKTLHDSEHILEEDHYGLKKVKERILEYLAVQT